MKTHLIGAVYTLCLMTAVCSDAATITPIRLDCQMVQGSAVTNLGQRLEIVTQGFSVLPPQGEDWCYRLMTSYGVTFKLPIFKRSFRRIPSHNELAALRMFGAIAISLKGLRDFRTDIQSPDELKVLVNILITEQLFSQVLLGVQSAEHRFHLLKSNVVTENHAEASCVRFNAVVEERGSAMAPDLVFSVNLAENLVCHHPTAPEIGLIWVGFVERYVQGDQPAAENLKQEWGPYLESVQFMSPR